VIVETFRERGIPPEEVQAVLVRHHGPFTWGTTAAKAVENAQVLEYVARLERHVRLLAPDAPRPDAHLVDRHYLRKHGGSAYYGQEK
jgi:L-ribulose-5-phosphate 4-epimerase